MTKKLLCFFLLIVAAASLSAFDTALQREYVILQGKFDYNLNPHQSSYASEAQILTGLYEGLFSYNPYSLEPVPAIAESYKISRNKKIWTFNIRKDAVYSDGTPITPEEIKRSWLALLSPEENGPFASLLDCIEGAEAYRTGKGSADDVAISINEDKLIVTLATPTEHFNKILCHHAFSAVPEKENVFSGPFVLTSMTDDEIILTKNQQYWDAENVALPSIRIVLSDDYEENTFQFNLGAYDWASDSISASKIYEANTINLAAEFGTEFLFFMTDKEPWNDPAIREALFLAAPWDELRADYYISADTLLLPLSGYPSVTGFNDTDVEAAREIIEESGLTAEELTLTYAVVDSSYSLEQAQLLADAWAEIGVTLNIKPVPDMIYLASFDVLGADIYSYNWIGDFADPVAFLELFRSSSSLRETAWTSQEYDDLLAEASMLTNAQDRYKKLAEAEQLLLDNFVIMPLAHSVSLNIIDLQATGGWYINSLDIHPYKYMYINQTDTAIPNLI